MDDQPVQEINIRRLLGAFQRWWWVTPLVLACCVVATVLITSRMPRIYQAVSQIEVRAPSPAVNAGMPGMSMSPDVYKQTQLVLLTNPSVADAIRERLKKTKYNVIGDGTIRSMVTYSDLRNTDLIAITASGNDPGEVAAVANAAAYGFGDYREKVSTESIKRDSERMTAQVQQAQQAMENSSARLAAFENRYGIVDIAAQTATRISDLSSAQRSLGQVEASLSEAQIRLDSIRNEIAGQNQMIQGSGERDDALIAQLRSHLTALQQQLQSAELTYVNPGPQTAPIRTEIADTQRRLQAELNKTTSGAESLATQERLVGALHSAERDVAALKGERELLTRQVLAANVSVKDLPAVEREIARLTQDADVKRDLYTKTLEEFGQIQMAKSDTTKSDEVDVTQEASVPLDSVSPRPVRNLFFGIVAGIVLGLLTTFGLDYLDEAVRNEDDLRALAPSLPVLAMLPRLQKSDIEAIDDDLHSMGMGPYRQLWTNLGFSSLDEPLHSLLVTSAVMGEGKSMTSANLARVAADEGKRVILVDCDLRRPSQHHRFGLPDSTGVCEIVAGKVALADALRPTQQERLSVLPAGMVVPHNPNVVLNSERMAKLIAELTAMSDLVILDAPPVLAVTDALLLGANTHSPVLQVIEGGRTRRAYVQKVIEALSRARLRHVGLVLNKVPKRSLEYYGYYYYYSYRADGKKATDAVNGSKRHTSDSAH